MKRVRTKKEQFKKTVSNAIDVMDRIEILVYIKHVTLYVGKCLFHLTLH